MADPLAPAPLNVRVTCPSPIAAEIAVGAVGSPAGIAVGEVAEATPVPTALIA